MRTKASLILVALLLSCCGRVRQVQLRPPIPVPPDMVWGYGVEKLRENPDWARRSAYLKAIDDLLSRGPVLVSKTVRDNTAVLNMQPVVRTLESTFRLHASSIIQPSFLETGAEDGFFWVVVGTTENDIRRGWQQFMEWRESKHEQAARLFREAQGGDRFRLLKESLALLVEIGAQEDPDLLYYGVRAALDSETERLSELKNLTARVEAFTRAGRLSFAEETLHRALELGLETSAYRPLKMEIDDRRRRALAFISAGDALFRDGHYGESLERYREAYRLDGDNPELAQKIALAEGSHRDARADTARATAGAIGWTVSRAVSDYFRWKREEAINRARETHQESANERKNKNAQSPKPVSPHSQTAAEPQTESLPVSGQEPQTETAPARTGPDPEIEEKREELRERRMEKKKPKEPVY